MEELCCGRTGQSGAWPGWGSRLPVAVGYQLISRKALRVNEPSTKEYSPGLPSDRIPGLIVLLLVSSLA